MKVKFEGNKLEVRLEDGQDPVAKAELVLRRRDGQILPVLIFEKAPPGVLGSSVIRQQVMRLIGPVHVSSGNKTFVLSSSKAADRTNSFTHLRSFPKLPRL